MDSSAVFNPTFFGASAKEWISKGYDDLDQKPIILMIENFELDYANRCCRPVKKVTAD